MNEARPFATSGAVNASFLSADAVRQAWIDAGRPGLLRSFDREYREKHQAQAADAPRVELWIRRKLTRRQAYWRVFGSGATFEWVEITKADRAEREGRITVGPLVDAAVVMYEEPVTQ